MQIKFTKIANISLKENVDFLEKIWTSKEINAFLDDVDNLTLSLKRGKFPQFQKYSRNIRSALIGKNHVRVYFRKENKNVIEILLYFDVRQNPEKLTELLKQ